MWYRFIIITSRFRQKCTAHLHIAETLKLKTPRRECILHAHIQTHSSLVNAGHEAHTLTYLAQTNMKTPLEKGQGIETR